MRDPIENISLLQKKSHRAAIAGESVGKGKQRVCGQQLECLSESVGGVME